MGLCALSFLGKSLLVCKETAIAQAMRKPRPWWDQYVVKTCVEPGSMREYVQHMFASGLWASINVFFQVCALQTKTWRVFTFCHHSRTLKVDRYCGDTAEAHIRLQEPTVTCSLPLLCCAADITTAPDGNVYLW